MEDTTCLLLIIVVVALYLCTNSGVIEGKIYDHQDRDCDHVTCEEVNNDTWNDIIYRETQNNKGQDCYIDGNLGHLTDKVNFGTNCPCQIDGHDDYCDNEHTCTKVIPDDTAQTAPADVILSESDPNFIQGNFRYACRSKLGHVADDIHDVGDAILKIF